jgi:hypothetical protein
MREILWLFTAIVCGVTSALDPDFSAMLDLCRSVGVDALLSH